MVIKVRDADAPAVLQPHFQQAGVFIHLKHPNSRKRSMGENTIKQVKDRDLHQIGKSQLSFICTGAQNEPVNETN